MLRICPRSQLFKDRGHHKARIDMRTISELREDRQSLLKLYQSPCLRSQNRETIKQISNQYCEVKRPEFLKTKCSHPKELIVGISIFVPVFLQLCPLRRSPHHRNELSLQSLGVGFGRRLFGAVLPLALAKCRCDIFYSESLRDNISNLAIK